MKSAGLALLLGTALCNPLQAAQQDDWQPNQWFVQSGVGKKTRAIAFGLQWNGGETWNWTKSIVATSYLDLSVGRWRADRADDAKPNAWFSEYSAIPVLRVASRNRTTWFVEIGIGPSYVTPLYQNGPNRFSTKLQFRNHLAFGFQWGWHARHELSLRVEHFSNSRIKQPNPGLNLLGIRYSIGY